MRHPLTYGPNKCVMCLALGILLLFCGLQAQDKPWSLSSTNNVYWFEGNTDKFDFYSRTDFSRADSVYELSAFYRFIYGELNGVKNNQGHLGGFTFDYRPETDLSPFAGLTMVHNAFRGFDIKMNVLLGAKYRFYHTATTDLSLSAAGVYEYVNFASPADPTVPEKSDDKILRLSLRPKFKWTFDKFKLTHITFYQPLFQDFGDYLIDSTTEIAFNVIKHVDLTINYFFAYNSRPAYASILKRDQQLVFGVNVSF
ncbi:MAG: DUF481 domain-containing protein [Saprospiraceae bacterium]|nr:DUF481 domain-containing protein [Saprospiraceae bacterium]